MARNTSARSLATKYSKSAIKIDSANVEQFATIADGAFPEYLRLPQGGKIVGGANDGLEYKGNDGIFAIIETETGKPVMNLDGNMEASTVRTMQQIGNGVGEGYCMHTTDDVTTLLMGALPAFGGECLVDAVWRNGHILVVAPTEQFARDAMSDFTNRGGNSKDFVIPRIVIEAPLGGLGGFGADFGMYRPLCMNLLCLQSVSGIHANIRHSASMRNRLDTLTAQFQGLVGHWDDILGQVERMKNNRVIVGDVIRQVFGDDDIAGEGRKKTVAENRIATIVGRLLAENAKLGIANDVTGPTLATNGWMLFNAIQGAFQHDFTRAEPNAILRGFDTWSGVTGKVMAKAETLCLAS